MFRRILARLRAPSPEAPELHAARAIIERDQRVFADNVPMSNLVRHGRWLDYLVEAANQPGKRILELGSREVVGRAIAKKRFSKAEYVGFDLYAGNNVDVVGDVHKLSTYFDAAQKFDVVFSNACFEHFAMPWIVAIETAKVLEVGGLVFVETHFSFSAHERPWHFFHFTDMALRTLFSPALGFECIEAGFSNPILGRFSRAADPHLAGLDVDNMYCHAGYLGRKVRDVPGFDWAKVSLPDIVGDTSYPEPGTTMPIP